MAGIIEKNAYLQLILKQAGDVSDGKYSWIDTECSGMVLDMQSNDFNQFGTLQDGKVFLLAPLKFEPLLPAKIVCDGKEYDIKGLKTLRNIRGVVLGHRLVAAGG
jgi:hypothetical protein